MGLQQRNLLAEALREHVGIQFNASKSRMWNRTAAHPVGIEDLGPDVWNEDGVNILGTPVGSDRFVEAVTEERLTGEGKLWVALPWVPALPLCVAALAQVCREPLPPHPPHDASCQSAQYAAGHGMEMRRAMGNVLGSVPGTAEQRASADWLGLRSAVRTAPPAFWASWAGALPGSQFGCQSLPVALWRASPAILVDVSPSWTKQPGYWTAPGSLDVQGGTS